LKFDKRKEREKERNKMQTISHAPTLTKYTLHNKLGDGGYGSVYICRDKVGNRHACKVLPFERNKRGRVQQELLILEKLSKATTRVPTLIDACEDQESFYLIQEWCKGGALKDYMEVHESYGENTVASIIRGVLRGLAHIHSRNIIHRDIKGSNIMLADKTDDADVKIIDFGAAILHTGRSDETIEVDELLGTLWFVPPESLSHRFHYKSDVWSVGVLTFQLLSGNMPFNDHSRPMNPSTVKIFKSIFTDEPSDMMRKGVWKNISDDAKDFVLQCLQKDYGSRPTAEDALAHPWLSKSDCGDRFTGTPLVCKPFVYDDMTIMNAQTVRMF
jgi:serine/threonine protein kinase